MTGYPSGQDGATVPYRKIVPFFHKSLIDPLLNKLVQSRWLDVGCVVFWVFMGTDSVLVHKCGKKELDLPAISTLRLVDNQKFAMVSLETLSYGLLTSVFKVQLQLINAVFAHSCFYMSEFSGPKCCVARF